MSDKVTGGCLCGAIRYESDAPPNHVYTCSCRMCQRHTGSAFWAGVKFPEGAFRYTKGQPQAYRSSKLLERYFCADCGSNVGLYYIENPWADSEPGMEVALGSLDHPEGYTPELHYGVESKHAWLQFDESVEHQRCDSDPELQAAFDKAGD